MKKKLVVLTGAGMSAESGISTFRDSGGLWEGHDVMEVASPEGWRKNKPLVLDFYNKRRVQLKNVKPNQGHLNLANTEKFFNVQIITQNVDDLHERAGSKNILHLHGELLKARSSINEKDIFEWKNDITENDKCAKGSQIRPHIVWFGEAVPAIEDAIEFCQRADIFVVIGTSLLVYPAAGLIDFVPPNTPKFIIDVKIPSNIPKDFIKIEKSSSAGTDELLKQLNEI